MLRQPQREHKVRENSLTLTRVINSLLCSSQLCHQLLRDIYFFFFLPLPGSPISKHVAPPQPKTLLLLLDLVYCVCIQIGSEMLGLITSGNLLL